MSFESRHRPNRIIAALLLPKKRRAGRVMYTTRMLKDTVESRLDVADLVRINGKHNLQIRGKHLRRLKKKLNVTQKGRYLVRSDDTV